MILANITKRCKESGVSIAKLERETGIGNGTISRWNASSPTVENVQKVADFFGCTVDELLRPDPDAPTS